MSTPAKDIATTVEHLPAVQADPMMMLGAAIEKGMSVADLGPLMDLVERDQANKARTAFMSAMADFQARCPTIRKTGKADRYLFPPLDECLKTIRPHMKATGLSIRFDTELTGDTVITAICYVMHKDGHTQKNQFAAPIDKSLSKAGNAMMNVTQQVGSARSYAKRYALMDALNLVGSEHDDDGVGAGTPTLTDKQIVELCDHIESLKVDEPKFLKFMGADCLENIPAAKWPAAMNAIERKRKAQEAEK